VSESRSPRWVTTEHALDVSSACFFLLLAGRKTPSPSATQLRHLESNTRLTAQSRRRPPWWHGRNAVRTPRDRSVYQSSRGWPCHAWACRRYGKERIGEGKGRMRRDLAYAVRSDPSSHPVGATHADRAVWLPRGWLEATWPEPIGKRGPRPGHGQETGENASVRLNGLTRKRAQRTQMAPMIANVRPPRSACHGAARRCSRTARRTCAPCPERGRCSGRRRTSRCRGWRNRGRDAPVDPDARM
jgi:hypothetical protein